MRPPAFSIRCFSLALAGVWSLVSYFTVQSYPGIAPVSSGRGAFRTNIALQSPALAIYSFFPNMRTLAHVVPLYRESSIISSTSFYVLSKAKLIAFLTSLVDGYYFFK